MTSKRQLSQDPSAYYQRGYSAGMRKLHSMREAWRVAVDRIRERMDRAERKAGIGRCRDCVFWTREKNCLWGYCSAEKASDSPIWPRTWAYFEGDKHSRQDRFSTSEDFGCVNFKAANPSSVEPT